MASNLNRGITNTAFSPNPDIVAQMTGSGNPNPGYNGPTTVGAGFTPVYAASIELAPILAYSRYVQIVTNSTIGNATLTAAFVPPAGAHLEVEIDNDATAARTITFGTGFRPTATVVGTTSKAIIVFFISNGTSWLETARSAAAV